MSYPIRAPVAIILHHSATEVGSSLNQEKGIWNGIKQSAIKKHGRPDYHFGIGASGNRYIGAPLDTWVVHCGIDDWDKDDHGKPFPETNQNTIGICAIGNFENVRMGEKQIQGIVKLLQELKLKYPKIYFKLHREMVATVCPGEHYPYLEIYKRVNKMSTTIVLRPQSEDKWYAVVNGVRMPITVKAVINGDQVELPACPVEINEAYYLPLRFITEKLGCTVTWDGIKKTITIKKE
jgi:hypothetical protein